MTEQEYQSWIKDFSNRFPDIGAWLKSKPATLRLWYDDCFSGFDLADCRAVNIQLMHDGALTENYNRDRICAIFIKRVAEIRHNRVKRVEETRLAQEAKRRKGVAYRPLEAVGGNRSTFACVNEVVKLPHHLRRAFIDQYYDAADPVTRAEDWIEDESELITPQRRAMTLSEVEKEDAASVRARMASAMNALGQF